MKDIVLPPCTSSVDVTLDLAGSKSIANRVLLLASVANGVSIIHNVPDISEDVMLMIKSLQNLGVVIRKIASVANGTSTYEITGCNGQFEVKHAILFCGNSGTTIRFLTAMLALMQGHYQLTCIQRMKERPIEDLLATLKKLGGQVLCVENYGYPPLEILPYIDNNIKYVELSGKMSSQYLTGLLMALPLLKRKLEVKIIDELISKPYVDITLGLLAKFGCSIKQNDLTYLIDGTAVDLRALEYSIEPDASSASYFLAIGALCGKVKINRLGTDSLQGDRKFASVLHQMGAKVSYLNDSITVSKPDSPLIPIDINMLDMPDVAMTLAVMCLFASGTSTISGISSWRVKETDRLAAMYNELTKLGATVTTTVDSITITPPKQIISKVMIETYDDHRMAMCFSLVAAYGVEIIIKNYSCVNKTFANYFELFSQVCY